MISSYVYSAPAAPSSVSYAHAYTVTTPTSVWNAPTFQTLTPLGPCTNVAESICADNAKGMCVDDQGVVYGILCDTMLSGVVITTSGKFLHKDKRSYTGTFEACAAFCDTFTKANCAGVSFEYGQCLAYDTVTGNFPNPAGGYAALRQ